MAERREYGATKGQGYCSCYYYSCIFGAERKGYEATRDQGSRARIRDNAPTNDIGSTAQRIDALCYFCQEKYFIPSGKHIKYVGPVLNVLKLTGGTGLLEVYY